MSHDDDVDLQSDDINDKIASMIEEAGNDAPDKKEKVENENKNESASTNEDTSNNIQSNSDDTSPVENNSKPKQEDAHAHGDDEEIIVIKKVKKVVHGHHGGAWKIAYADFVTAMMAFFLLMWLLSMLNKYQIQGISEYFSKPIHKAADPKEEMDKVHLKEGTATSDVLKKPTDITPANIDSDKETKQGKDEAKEEATKAEQKGEQTAGEQHSVAEKEPDQILEDVKKDLEQHPMLQEYKNALNFKVISQGLKIEIRDLENQSMFSTGKTDFAKYANEILDWLANLLNTYPNRVMIVGHTDSHKFINNNVYSNWELSADRATATRRALVDFGMGNDKIVRVAGVADTDKLENTSVDDAANRRIAIIVLTDEAYKELLEQ